MELLIPEFGLIIYQILAFVSLAGLVYLAYKLIKHFFNITKRNKQYLK